jgi:Putative papain-like cysteine peptidase (DUF1796)
MHKVISFGYRCSCASFLKILGLKTESHPFDWIVSKLDVVQDCIETNFIHFLNPDNYSTMHTETLNMIDGTKIHIGTETIEVNTYYESKLKCLNNTGGENNSTYDFKLALTHNNLKNQDDFEYYQRCVARLYELFEVTDKKYYLYLHPIVGKNDYLNKKDTILSEFSVFHQFLLKKTTNLFGIYFILVKDNNSSKSVKLVKGHDYDVIILYCNENFLDAGGTFMGNYHAEEAEVVNILRNYFV